MKHIMIVDDDIHINQMLEEVLTSAGYKVTHAYSGTEALLLLPSTKPDLILLDLMLPGLSGEEIIEEISHIPVIVISAKIDTKNKISLLLNGAVDYVTKRNRKSESGVADTRYWNVVPFRWCSYSGGIVLFHSSDITSKPKRYISENGGIVHEFFWIGKAFCVQKARKKYSLIVDCFCNQYPASCRCGEQKCQY